MSCCTITGATRPKRAVLDTDTYNEIDDQFALAYALLAPECLDMRAVVAAPFGNRRAATPLHWRIRSGSAKERASCGRSARETG